MAYPRIPRLQVAGGATLAAPGATLSQADKLIRYLRVGPAGVGLSPDS
jgi:hypothetical protein